MLTRNKIDFKIQYFQYTAHGINFSENTQVDTSAHNSYAYSQCACTISVFKRLSYCPILRLNFLQRELSKTNLVSLMLSYDIFSHEKQGSSVFHCWNSQTIINYKRMTWHFMFCLYETRQKCQKASNNNIIKIL